ncbi:hypothetical protein RF11_09149 [Thelohanellus kitauei]|uniref:Uncharacterized protein n=1 Tax=Thelohanellus kitauei TaxID=669202 RepID=A0A0C2N4A0_THEKT|nr:hypothetical protein RF11_09149 [Thelohanellus kitauei]
MLQASSTDATSASGMDASPDQDTITDQQAENPGEMSSRSRFADSALSVSSDERNAIAESDSSDDRFAIADNIADISSSIDSISPPRGNVLQDAASKELQTPESDRGLKRNFDDSPDSGPPATKWRKKDEVFQLIMILFREIL